GADATGTVSEINDGGLVVDLPLDVEAFVPASHLQRPGRPADAYQIGDELELQVIRMDREDRELVMSETAKIRSAERAERDAEYRQKQQARRQERREVESYGSRQSGPATLGEISGLAALRDQMAEAEADAPEADVTPEEVETPEVLSTPAGEVVDEALGSEDDGPEPDAELGNASASVDGDPGDEEK
ncbi:MAG: S1 RNA-binding domain-containing protein, partial [Bacteroidota bacterium]